MIESTLRPAVALQPLHDLDEVAGRIVEHDVSRAWFRSAELLDAPRELHLRLTERLNGLVEVRDSKVRGG